MHSFVGINHPCTIHAVYRSTHSIFVVIAAALPVYADEEADALFESVFGDAHRQAKASRSRQDDLELATRLIEAANKTSDNSAIVEKLCNEAFALTSKLQEGQSLAIKAQRLIVEHVPNKRIDASDALLSLYERAARIGTAEERLATRAKLSDASNLQIQLNETLAKQKLIIKKESYETRLLQDANDTAAAKELVHLSVIDFDDLAEARRIAPRTGDTQLTKLVALASKDTNNLNEADQLTLATWYRSLLSQAQTNAGRLRLCDRALQALTDIQSGNPTATTKLKASPIFADVSKTWRKLPASRTIDLTQVKPVYQTTNSGIIRFNKGADITTNGKKVTRYIFAHAKSILAYQLSGRDRAFRAQGYLHAKSKDGVRFTIKIDGEGVFSSDVLIKPKGTLSIEVDIPFGAKKLELIINRNRNFNFDWSYWLEPELIR